MAEHTRSTVSILFSDGVGHPTPLDEAQDGPSGAVAGPREALRGLVEKYGGLWVGEIGGGVLSTFGTAASAVSCGLEMQRAFAGDAESEPRIGIHIGELVFRETPGGTEVFGDPIVVAARLPGLADPGGICLSGGVYHALPRDRRGLDFEYLGERELKSVDRPVAVYRVVEPASVPLGALGLDGNDAAPRRSPWLLPLASTAAAALAVVAAFWVSQSERPASVGKSEIGAVGAPLPTEQESVPTDLLAFAAVRDELLAFDATQLGARLRTIPDPVKNDTLYHVEFEADCECTVLVFAVNGVTDEVALLYPNHFEPRAQSARGLTVRIPSSQEWNLRAVGHAGVDVLKLIAVREALDFPRDRSVPWVTTPDRQDRVEELRALLERVRAGASGTASAPLRIVP
jgi:class 3 adenylate cyclase